MKRFFLPLVVGVALTSCSRDNDDVTTETAKQPMPPPVLLTALNWTDSNGDASNATFIYDGTKIKEIVSKEGATENYKITFTYTGNQITSMVDSNDTETTSKTFTYNPNGTLKSSISVEKETSGSNNYSTTITKNYTYLNNGDVYVTESKTSTDPNYTPRNKNYTITTSNGNIYKIVSKSTDTNAYGTNENTTTTIFQYDTQNNPFKNVTGFSAIAIDALDDLHYFGFTNNISHEEDIRTYKYTPASGTATTSTSTRIKAFTLEYNTNNYPIKQVSTETSSLAGSTPYTETITYTYNK